MKNKLFTILFSFLFALPCLLFTGCKNIHEHSFGDWAIECNSTCSSKAIYSRVCKCGEKETKEDGDLLEHSLSSWFTESENTCIEAEVLKRTCSSCNYYKNKLGLPAAGHMEGDWETCFDTNGNETGYQEMKCATCAAVLDCVEKEYQIIFISNGGNLVNSIITKYNGIVQKPKNLERVGYIFGGWYTDNNIFSRPFFV